jgi:hypothetical protein
LKVNYVTIRSSEIKLSFRSPFIMVRLDPPDRLSLAAGDQDFVAMMAAHRGGYRNGPDATTLWLQ